MTSEYKKNSEQNGLSIELDSWKLVRKPSPIGTTPKYNFFLYLG